MTDQRMLDHLHHFIMQTFVKSGNAPHYTDIAREFEIRPDAGKSLLHELMNAELGAMWLHPNTDYIVTFAPFNNLPTQYRITVDGQQKWFTPGGFDALAVCWAFPGKRVQVDAPCLDCGEPIHVILSDGEIISHSPQEVLGYTNVALSDWGKNWSFTGGRMNLFRSEEHIKNWSEFQNDSEDGILSLHDIMTIFSTPLHTEKLSAHYVSSISEYKPLFMEKIKEIKGNSPFWTTLSFDASNLN